MIKWILRPFIDLNPCFRGPLFAQGVEYYWNAFIDPEQPQFVLQRTLPRVFRSQVLLEIGYNKHIVDDPRALPNDLRSPRWTTLCNALADWRSLSKRTRCRLALLLHAVCFYKLIEELVPPLDGIDDLSDQSSARLAYLRASSSYVLSMPNRVSDYGGADLDAFVQIANSKKVHPTVGFDASIKIFTHLAKNKGSETELVEWRERAAAFVETMRNACSAFDLMLAESRFYRAAAFIPQIAGNKCEVARLMELAEQLAEKINSESAAQNILRLENLHPLLESRTKEALWLGDLDAALERSQKVTVIDPFEARGWLELGQVLMRRGELDQATEAYCTAALVGPPASAISRHMAGVCLQQRGKLAEAALMYKSAISFDPQVISPHDQILKLPDHPVFEVIKKWSLRSAKL
ncbi:MAG: tetratricopeptide repeat protein [Hyphomicrobiaceae bacterium]